MSILLENILTTRQTSIDLKRIATIIVCMGNSDETRGCIKSILEWEPPNNHILVVENGTDENFKMLSSEFPKIEFVLLKNNLGFAGGNNSGMKHAKKQWDPDYYFLINNDARIKNGTMASLIEAMERNPLYGMAAPKILANEDEKIIWAAGGSLIPSKFLARNRGQNTKDTGQYDQSETCDFLSGCALLIRKEVIETVGLFDESFFMYSEDLDYCLRSQKRGWKLWYQADALAIHPGSITAGGEFEPFQSFFRWRNRLLLVYKHANFMRALILYFVFAPLLILRDSFRYLIMKKFKSLTNCWKGLFQFIRMVCKIEKAASNSIETTASTYTPLNHGYLVKNPLLLFTLRAVDLVGAAIFKSNRSMEPANPQKILVSKIDHLGDVLLSLYLVSQIKRKYPSAQIHFLCGSWALKIVEKNPQISRVVTFDHFMLNRQGHFCQRIIKTIRDTFAIILLLRKESYDIGFEARAYFPNFIPWMALANIHYLIGYATGGFGFILNNKMNWRKDVHETEHLLDLLRGNEPTTPASKLERPNLDYLLDSQGAAEFLRLKGIDLKKPYVVIHPFAQKSRLHKFKYWKDEYWKSVIDLLELRGYPILCTGDEQDDGHIEQLLQGSKGFNLAGQTAIPLLSKLLKDAKLVFCIDTFVSHLSSLLGTKTIVLFHNSESEIQWKPAGESTVVLHGGSTPRDVMNEIEKILKNNLEEKNDA